jgi:hypothetical protein
MCSSTRGPASAPSLVTWPTRNTVVSVSLAKRTSLRALSRTWETLPGAEVRDSVNRVWMESTTSTRGRSAAAVARMLDAGLRQQPQAADRAARYRPRQPEPVRAQAHLLRRLLAGDVEHRLARRHRGGGLQQQRRLADAGIAADQHHRARHQAAAEHPVQLDAARRGGSGCSGQRRGPAPAAAATPPPAPGPAAAWPGGGRARAGSATSSMLFQAPQSGHWPDHFGCWAPQALQT